MMNVMATLFAPGGGGSAYTSFETITIDHTQCGSSDSTNYPMLFRTQFGVVNTSSATATWVSGDKFGAWLAGKNVLINGVVYAVSSVGSSTSLTLSTSAGTQTSVAWSSNPELRTVANGGSIQNTATVASITVPTDLVFSSDNAGASLYTWEVEFYDPVTGKIDVWINVPTVSHTADTVFYMPYNAASVTTFQGGAGGAAWNSAFKGVWHLSNGTTLNLADSIAAYTSSNTGATATAGQIDGGAAIGTSHYINSGGKLGAGLTGLTAQCLVFNTSANPSVTALGNYNSASDLTFAIDIAFGAGTIASSLLTSGIGSRDICQAAVGTGVTVNKWCLIHQTWDGTNHKLYVNGVLQVSQAVSGANVFASPTLNTAFGAYQPSTSAQNLPGNLDEIRFANVARSADWITAENTNFFNPAGGLGSSGFYSIS